MGTLPLLPRGSHGGQGFPAKEGFRREDCGLVEAPASLPVASARPFASSEPQLPCPPGRDIHICPGVGMRTRAGQA